MSGPENGVRQLVPPRRVFVDPARVWVLPRTTPRQSIGMRAHSFNTQPDAGDLSWMPATQYSWLLLYTTGAMWYAEIELTIRARNKHREVTVRQWVPADAVRLPTPEDLKHWQS